MKICRQPKSLRHKLLVLLAYVRERVQSIVADVADTCPRCAGCQHCRIVTRLEHRTRLLETDLQALEIYSQLLLGVIEGKSDAELTKLMRATRTATYSNTVFRTRRNGGDGDLAEADDPDSVPSAKSSPGDA